MKTINKIASILAALALTFAVAGAAQAEEKAATPAPATVSTIAADGKVTTTKPDGSALTEAEEKAAGAARAAATEQAAKDEANKAGARGMLRSLTSSSGQ